MVEGGGEFVRGALSWLLDICDGGCYGRIGGDLILRGGGSWMKGECRVRWIGFYSEEMDSLTAHVCSINLRGQIPVRGATRCRI